MNSRGLRIVSALWLFNRDVFYNGDAESRRRREGEKM
jgi:hypothetical protein